MSGLLEPTYVGTFKLGQREHFADVFIPKSEQDKRKRHWLAIICTYVIACTATGRVYVGATQNFYKRWKLHLNRLRAGGHANIQLQAEFNQYGEEAFTIGIATQVDCTERLEYAEPATAELFKPEQLLNYIVGKRVKDGWNVNHNRRQDPYKPKLRRGPNSVSRWFDFTSVKR